MNKEKLLTDPDLKWIDKKISLEMEPFLDCIRTDPEVFYKFAISYNNFFKRLTRTYAIITKLNDDAKKVHSSLYKTFSYLGFIESYGNTIVDMLVLLCIAKGSDFHIECQHTTPRIKHAKTLEDLENERVPLSTKLNFLKDNGFNFLSSIIDTKLRNAIAHMKFEIKGDDILIDGKQITEVKLTNNTRETVQALIAVHKLINEVMSQKGKVQNS